MKLKLSCAALAFLLCTMLLAGCQAEENQSETASGIQSVTLEGEAFTSADITGNKLTVLNIWATWCPPCVAELPELQKINETYRDKGVEVVGVLQDGITQAGEEDAAVIASAKALLQDAGALYSVILPDDVLQQEFIATMQYFPTTFFLDSTGKVVDTIVGANNYEDWSEKIDEALEALDG